MGRLTPMTTRMIDRAWNLYDQLHVIFSRDGVIDAEEHTALLGIQRLRGDTERLDISRRVARTIEDACELTEHAGRLLYEMERDLGPVEVEEYDDKRRACITPLINQKSVS